MMDDMGTPVIGGASVAAGWRPVTVLARGRSVDVFISPEGVRYVRAEENEHADLIYHRVSRHFARPIHVRLRREEGSRLARGQRRERRLVARGDNQRRRRARMTRRTT